jgi:hypothetical protein
LIWNLRGSDQGCKHRNTHNRLCLSLSGQVSQVSRTQPPCGNHMVHNQGSPSEQIIGCQEKHELSYP